MGTGFRSPVYGLTITSLDTVLPLAVNCRWYNCGATAFPLVSFKFHVAVFGPFTLMVEV
jgi:hypothetical protein